MSTNTNRIISIDGDAFLLPETFSEQNAFLLLSFLSSARKLDSFHSNYIPDEESEYATRALVVRPRPIDVELKLTADPIMTRAEFEAARESGKALYDAKHPKGP
jgi:hypothetical protein